MATTNVTAILGKASVLDTWQCSVVALSETSRAKKAVPSILSEFRSFGYKVALSESVPDRFAVSSPDGSLRGLSRGTALVAKYPMFSPRPSFLPAAAWMSQRICYSVLQIGPVPLRVVVVYLHPNPTPGSYRHRLNSQLLDWACSLVEDLSAPACVLGDFNSPWSTYEVCESLSLKGWVDLHAFWAQQKGEIPGPTCKQSTRHIFMLANPLFRPFVCDVHVGFEDDLDAHSVLIAKLSVPSYNPVVWKWLLPGTLDNCEFDPLLQSAEPDCRWYEVFESHLAQGQVSKAYAHWSSGAEQVLLQSAVLDNGPVVHKRFCGRGQSLQPVRRSLAAPRFKQGRPTDFTVPHPTNGLLVRQVQKQARRLQNLARLLQPHLRVAAASKIGDLWQSILRATGFGKSFAHWVFKSVRCHVLELTAECVQAKRKNFTEFLENNCVTQGGRVPFKLVREAPLPPVQELELTFPLTLAPQRWSPIGKAWIAFQDTSFVNIGDQLTWTGGASMVTDKQEFSLLLSGLLQPSGVGSAFSEELGTILASRSRGGTSCPLRGPRPFTQVSPCR